MLDAVGLSIGNFRLSLLLKIKIVVTLGIGLWASISISNFLDHRLQRNKNRAPGLRLLIAKIMRISLLVVAAAIAVSAIGLDLTILSVFSGAIGKEILKSPPENKLIAYLCSGYVKEFLDGPELEKLNWKTRTRIGAAVYQNSYPTE
jgi:hypothetical protein